MEKFFKGANARSRVSAWLNVLVCGYKTDLQIYCILEVS